jgi:CelD/BcsL family acetyltransferase involved in cellulose biosynthesis
MVDAPVKPAFDPHAGGMRDPVAAAPSTAFLPNRKNAQAQAVWMQCWLGAYAPNGALSVAGLRLLRQRHGITALWQNLLHSPTNLQTPRHSAAGGDMFSRADVGLSLKRHRAAGIMLEYLPEPDMATITNALQSAGRRYLAMPQAAIPVTDCNSSFEHFVEQRSKRERQRTRRLLRLAEGDDSPLRFSVIKQGDQVEALVEQCLALEHASWKGREGTAILDKPEDARFYRQLAQDLATAGLLRLALLHDRNGLLVAFELCMLWDDRLIALKTSCSEQHLDLSPGHVLALLHIRQCCADHTVSLYDVTGNGLTPAPHLLRYADRQELLWRVILFAPGWRGRLLQLVWQARLRLRSVKRFVARQRG